MQTSLVPRTPLAAGHAAPLLTAFGGAALVALSACGGGGAGAEGPRPNVLLVTLDTTRPDFMGTYGHATPTPAFDALAEEGARFDAALSCSGLTPASHATILTGLYPYRHGVRVLSADSGFRLPPEQETLTTILAESGYATGAVNSAFPVTSHFGFDVGFDEWESVEGELNSKGKGWDVNKFQRRSDETTSIAVSLLDRLPEPFFLWIHYWDPHDPGLVPPPELVPDPVAALANGDELYALEVLYVDRQFGRLCDELRSRGVWDRTLVVVTSDHGQGLTDGKERHGWSMHRMVYQEQIRVPLLLSGPGVPAGRVIEPVVRTADIAPTVLELLDLPAPGGLDGDSLMGLVRGEPEPPRQAYAEQINGYDRNAGMLKKRPDAGFLYCVVHDGWKLVYRPHMIDRSELFHLRDDPLELQNLFASRADIRRTMLLELARIAPWVLGPFPPDGQAGAQGVDEALASLGYTAGSVEEDREWRWTCPGHLEHRQDDPGEHPGCGDALVPVQD